MSVLSTSSSVARVPKDAVPTAVMKDSGATETKTPDKKTPTTKSPARKSNRKRAASGDMSVLSTASSVGSHRKEAAATQKDTPTHQAKGVEEVSKTPGKDTSATKSSSKSRRKRAASGDMSVSSIGASPQKEPASPHKDTPAKKVKVASGEKTTKTPEAQASAKQSSKKSRRKRAESGDMSVVSTASASSARNATAMTHSQEDTTPANHKSGKKSKTPPTKPAPVMDVAVHRLRHLGFHPKSILGMKSTPLWSKHSLLALSRENGYIELKSLDQKFRTLATVSGYKDRPVTSMAWIKASAEDPKPLLVGASRDGVLFLVDFAKLNFVGVTASGGGGIFALESLSAIPGCESLVVAGCEDGSVRIFEYKENGSFLLVSSIPTAGAAILSLTWKQRYTTGTSLDGLTIFASVADGTIRRYDGTDQLDRVTWKSATRITVESRGRNIATRVWALCILQDGTLISADSLGQVQFWDSETGSLKQTIEQSDSKADVLDLAVSTDETKIFASGVDSRVVCMEKQSDNQRWLLTHAQRPHTHDVKSLEICRKKTKQKTLEGEPVMADILVTGGVDTKICTYDMGMFSRRRPRTIYPWPTTTPVFMAAKARMLGLMREDKVDIYRLHEKQTTKISTPVLVPEEETLIGTVEIRHPSNLSCAAISSGGKYLAVANMASFYLFALSFGGKGLEATRISLDLQLKEPVSAMRFLSENIVALSCTNGVMHILSLDKTGVDHKIHSLGTVVSDASDFSFGSISTTPSGAFVALQRNGWNDGGVDIISVEKDGSARPHWTLPTFDSPVTNVTFLGDDRLAVACLNFSLYIFDVKERRLNQWNESAGYPISLPSELRDRKDYPVRLLPHGGNPNQVLMVSLT